MGKILPLLSGILTVLILYFCSLEYHIHYKVKIISMLQIEVSNQKNYKLVINKVTGKQCMYSSILVINKAWMLY